MLDRKDDDNEIDDAQREERIHSFALLKKTNLKQESIARQKSRVNWLASGDMNTNFFHLSTNWRKAKNMFKGMRIHGEWCEELKVVKE